MHVSNQLSCGKLKGWAERKRHKQRQKYKKRDRGRENPLPPPPPSPRDSELSCASAGKRPRSRIASHRIPCGKVGLGVYFRIRLFIPWCVIQRARCAISVVVGYRVTHRLSCYIFPTQLWSFIVSVLCLPSLPPPVFPAVHRYRLFAHFSETRHRGRTTVWFGCFVRLPTRRHVD